MTSSPLHAVGRLTDTLVICTRNRVIDVERCLASVMSGTRLPANVLIVDSSDGAETEELVEGLASLAPQLPLAYVHTAPGLPYQRNCGIKLANGEVIHFLDDDAVVAPRYFERLMALFEEDLNVGGATGVIEGVNRNRRHG